jgi:transposase
MEATGVYWKPVWHILQEKFTLILANAAHVRNLPGRKSDVNDALLAHGLIRPRFVPPAPVMPAVCALLDFLSKTVGRLPGSLACMSRCGRSRSLAQSGFSSPA